MGIEKKKNQKNAGKKKKAKKEKVKEEAEAKKKAKEDEKKSEEVKKKICDDSLIGKNIRLHKIPPKWKHVKNGDVGKIIEKQQGDIFKISIEKNDQIMVILLKKSISRFAMTLLLGKILDSTRFHQNGKM